MSGLALRARARNSSGSGYPVTVGGRQVPEVLDRAGEARAETDPRVVPEHALRSPDVGLRVADVTHPRRLIHGRGFVAGDRLDLGNQIVERDAPAARDVEHLSLIHI